MLGELRAYTFFAFRMVAVATISASADTIRMLADRLIAFSNAIRIFTLSSIRLFAKNISKTQ